MSSPIKILHCADLHLGSELTSTMDSSISRDISAKERRQELLSTFRKICNICRDEHIDLLLIAGDLFEGSNVDDATIQSVSEYLGDIGDTIAAISPGNHDYVSIDSPYSHIDWPDNVIIFRSALETITFEERGFSVSGAGFTGTYQRDPLLKCKEELNSELVNICVIHGDLASLSSESLYNPITEYQIKNSGFDYLALGHIHKRSEISYVGKSYYAYSGCPDGRGFDELGPKGVYIGTVSKNRVNLHFRPICSRMYLTEEIDISQLESESQIKEYCLSQLEKRFGEDFYIHFYKLILTGYIPEGFILPLDSLSNVLKEKLHFAKLQDRTHVEFDYEKLAKESSLRGIFVRKMLERVEKAKAEDSNKSEDNDDFIKESDKLWKALELGLMAFEGEVKLDDYEATIYR